MAESLRILILEDNPADAELMQFELQEAGFVFTSKVVMTEEDFDRELREFSADLILSDYDLPQYNGTLALAAAKKRCPDTPFILVTGAVTEDRAIDILTQGAKDYVLKTRLDQRLIPAVRRALAEVEEHRALKQAEEELLEAHRTLERLVAERTETLRKTEGLYHSLFDNMMEGLAYCRIFFDQGRPVDFVYLDVNRSFESLTGLKNVVGKRVSEVIPGIHETDSELLEAYARVALTGQSERFDLYVKALQMWFSVSVYSPQKEYFVAVFDVISERKRTEALLQDSEKRYRRLFESAQDGILILDADTGKVDDVNPFLLQLLGYSYDELYGKHIWELGVFKDIAASKEAFKALQDNEYIRYDDLPLETVNGQIIAVEVVSNVYLVDHHKVIQCNIRDITKQKKVKDEKEQILNNLQEEKDRLQALINGINDEIWFADDQKRFTLANPSALHEFGMNSDAGAIDVQKFAESLEVYRPDGSARPVEEAPPLRALKGEVVKNQEEMVRTRSSGEIRHRQVSSNPVRDADGKIIGSVSVVRDITERKRMEDTLRVSEERFSKAFKFSPNAITITRISDGKILEGNDSAYDLLGYNHDEVVGKTTFDLGIWADADERVKLTQDLATQGFIRNQEFTLLKKDRTPVIVDLNAVLINIDNQQCFLTSFIDITERKKTEEAFKESEKKFRELVKYAPIAIYEIDFRSRKLVTVNDAMVLLTGYTRDELLSMDVLDLLHDESKKAFTSRISEMLKGERPDENVEYKVIAKDGHIIDAVLNVSFKIDEQGIPIGATVVGHDITERKRTEEALKESEDRYRGAVENTTAIILRIAPSGLITFANRRALDFFGYSAEELIGRHAIGTIVPPQETTGRDLAAMVDRIIADPDRFHSNANENMCKDGRRVWIEWTNSGVYDSQGRLQEFLSVGIDATDRKRAERDLERFNALMDYNPSLVFLKDESGKYVYLNSTYQKHFVGSNDWYGKTDFDFWPKESAELFRANDAEVLRTGQTHQYLEESNDMNGTRYCWLCYKFVFTDSQGQKYLGGIGIDATDRVRAEEELRSSEERYRALFNSMSEGFALHEIITDTNGRACDYRFLDINPAFEELTGLKREGLLGKSVLEVLPGTETHWIEKYGHVALDGEPVHFENYSSVLDRWYEVFAYQPAPRQFAVLFSDITERKRAEIALLESEKRFRSVLDNSRDAIYRVNIQSGRYDYISPSAGQVVGYAPEELMALSVKAAMKIHPEDIPAMKEALARLEETGHAEAEYRQKTKDGDYIWISNSMSVTRDDAGKPQYRDGIIRNITERKRADEDLKRKTADLESAVTELDSFTYSVSHDLRAPLRAIDGFSRMLLKDAVDRLDPDDARKLRVISKNSEKMGQLIDDLLNLSRTGRVEIHFDQLNIKSIVEDTWREIRAGNPGRNMELIIGDLPPARGDLTLLRQLFSNLIGNAVKFTKNMEKALIDVTGCNTAEFNTYCVKDNGAGFDMEYYDKLFEVFRRLHSESQYEGTGVGLAIVKKILERHSGKIWAESKPGEGATFYFTLPAVISTQG